MRVQAYYDRERDDAILYQPQETSSTSSSSTACRSARTASSGAAAIGAPATTSSRASSSASFRRARRRNWTNLFVQDEIKLGERFDLTLGSSFEHNDYTGTELLPSARWRWKLADDHCCGRAVSRAVRAPARLDRDIALPPNPPFIIAGGPDFESEVANVFELGYRGQPSRDVSFSVTAFYQDWDRLRSGQCRLTRRSRT